MRTHVFVGSANRVKIDAAKMAVEPRWQEVIVKGYEVPTGVNEQPRSDAECRQGAENRALRALERGLAEFPTARDVLAVSMEGGVADIDGELWNSVWAAATDREGRMIVTNGSRFLIPKAIAEPIRAGGEMGPVVDQLSGISDIRSKQGMIGLVTNNFVTRAEEYGAVVKLAIGIWLGQFEPWQHVEVSP